jgi:hypothetical protein
MTSQLRHAVEVDDDSGTRPARVTALRRAAVCATLAPSIHNTQPWRIVVGPDRLDVYADWNRRLRVLDPRGRQLLISCGCAVFNAKVAIAAAGYGVRLEWLAEPGRADLLARLTLTDDRAGLSTLRPLCPAIDVRRTNRRPFADIPVPGDVIETLIGVAAAEGAELIAITRRDHRRAVAALTQQADRVETEDPAYRAELRAWTSDDPQRVDGVSAASAPFAGIGAFSSDTVPIRVFDTRGMGWLPAESNSGVDQCMLLLGTRGDGPAAWLTAGAALERVLLEITRLGYAASPLTQMIEVAATNLELRRSLRLSMYPNVLLRVGLAPETVRTRRRRLVDVLTEEQ